MTKRAPRKKAQEPLIERQTLSQVVLRDLQYQAQELREQMQAIDTRLSAIEDFNRMQH